MSIVITECGTVSVSYQRIVDLIHESFRERTDQGLLYSCAGISAKDFINKTRNGIVMVAIDDETGRLVGTGTLQVMRGKNNLYGYLEYDAVADDYKRKGIGSLLMEARIQRARELGLNYILSDTASKALSAVKYHKRNGFRIVGYASFRSTNYFSYIFRKQIKPSILWNNIVWLSIHFVCSFLYIRFTRKENGQLTFIGTLTNYLRQSFRRFLLE